MLIDDLLRCQISEWYPLFISHTIPTRFHSLPSPFLSYLRGLSCSTNSNSDSDSESAPPFLLPCSTSRNSAFPQFPSHTVNPDPDSNFDSDSDSDSEIATAPSFPELESEVERSIAVLGGQVVPKLNWSAPKDATWISPIGSLKCESFFEISLLLRSSDSIMHDLTEALPSCQDYEKRNQNRNNFQFSLALRKWVPGIRPEFEFRCFVRGKELVAISQREITAFYPSILAQKEEIINSIWDFFDQIVKLKFESENYTFDVYLTKKLSVKIIDFNPWGGFTLPLLFNWEELGEMEGRDGVEIRVIESRCGVRPGLKSAVPFDYLDTGEGSGWDQFLRKADEQIREQMKREKQMGD